MNECVWTFSVHYLGIYTSIYLFVKTWELREQGNSVVSDSLFECAPG